jgi:putative glutamine amidotransferase
MSQASDVTKKPPRVAIPVPHSGNREYADRALPQYEDAVRQAGGEPVRIELELSPADVLKQAEGCDAVLLPGSRADVNPEKYNAARHEKTADMDVKRDLVDDLLLEHAYDNRKPVLAICYGLQSLNVYRSGSLVQHIESAINHSPGRTVANAHNVAIDPGSRLAKIVGRYRLVIPANSSHHQAAEAVGRGLKIVARCPDDGVVEALEGTAPDHFVLAVQWHPERLVTNEAPELAESARTIFRAFVEAAREKRALTGA